MKFIRQLELTMNKMFSGRYYKTEMFDEILTIMAERLPNEMLLVADGFTIDGTRDIAAALEVERRIGYNHCRDDVIKAFGLEDHCGGNKRV